MKVGLVNVGKQKICQFSCLPKVSNPTFKLDRKQLWIARCRKWLQRLHDDRDASRGYLGNEGEFAGGTSQLQEREDIKYKLVELVNPTNRLAAEWTP